MVFLFIVLSLTKTILCVIIICNMIGKKIIKALIGVVVATGVFGGLIAGAVAINKDFEEQQWQRICNGTTITEKCSDEDGNRYSKFVFHKAEPEKTEKIYHAAVAAKTHVVHHPAEYGTRTYRECIKTSISYKSGTCALSQCRDGSYSGSTGRGTCSYHGGVARRGGPWYTTRTETYVKKAAWDEVVVDVPAKEAWTETKVIASAKEAWTEKVLAN